MEEFRRLEREARDQKRGIWGEQDHRKLID
jgi:endonuclease YncB( thermonuclease family)